MPYFVQVDETRFAPTEHVSGAWNPDQQHIAPALGLLAHLVETDRDQRRDDRPVLTRLSYDILGTVAIEEVAVTVEVLRPGRTIELVEAVMTQRGRAAVRLRAWLMTTHDTHPLAASDLPPIPPPERTPVWDAAAVWPGGFIASAQVRRAQVRPGRAHYWVRTDVPLLDRPSSRTAAAAGLLDIANGMTVRADPEQVTFPNIDLTAHLLRPPSGDWLGFDTTVSFGPLGHGVTSSVLHDAHGPLGTMSQTLTVRPTRPS